MQDAEVEIDLDELVEEIEKFAPLTDEEIEQKYVKGYLRIITQRNDFLLPQIKEMLKSNSIILRPMYQRRLVWGTTQKSLFIESILMNVPIPPVFLYEVDYSTSRPVSQQPQSD
jgi:hypothetical protein